MYTCDLISIRINIMRVYVYIHIYIHTQVIATIWGLHICKNLSVFPKINTMAFSRSSADISIVLKILRRPAGHNKIPFCLVYKQGLFLKSV